MIIRINQTAGVPLYMQIRDQDAVTKVEAALDDASG